MVAIRLSCPGSLGAGERAEREGFEPPELSLNCFQDSRHKPLGHLSVTWLSLRVVGLDFPIVTPTVGRCDSRRDSRS